MFQGSISRTEFRGTLGFHRQI